ncbi:MAG: ABC transporter ATP-binding protein [Marinobacter sp.]
MTHDLTKPLTMTRLMALAPKPLSISIMCAVVAATFSILPLWFVYRVVAEFESGTPAMGFIWQQIAWIAMVLMFRWGLMAVSHVQAHKGAFRIQHSIKIAMASRLGEVPLSFFSGRGSGGLRRVVNDDANSLEGFFAHMLPDIAASATVPVVAATLLMMVDWRLGLAVVAPLPLALLGQWWFMRKSGERIREWSALQQNIAEQMSEYIRGIHLIKTFGLNARSFGELSESIRGAVVLAARFARQSSTAWVVFVSLLGASMAIVAPFGAWRVLERQLELSTLILFLLVAPTVLSPLLRLTFAYGEHMQRQEALKRIGAILGSAPLKEAPAANLPADQLAIEFRHVSQRYQEHWVLDDVSFSACHGQLTAIVGASGSGKSTLLRLIARLYEYEKGEVLIGGRDLRDWPLDSLLARISVVLQDVFLFHGSIRDNLRMAKPAASDEEIEQAARAARAHEFIINLPDGYDANIGELGTRLSGGERQRISIARALLKNAPILLLDEATASVDADNEMFIQQAINALCRERTVLMIAHRLDTVMHADRIIVMDHGRLVGCGRHADLLASCNVYQRLWAADQRARHWTLNVSTEGDAS